jgi:hypothetical protein
MLNSFTPWLGGRRTICDPDRSRRGAAVRPIPLTWNSPPNCHPERSRGIRGFLSVSVTTLGCPILAQRGWETITARSSIAGPALRPLPGAPDSRAHAGIHPQIVIPSAVEGSAVLFLSRSQPWVPHPRAARVGDHHGALAPSMSCKHGSGKLTLTVCVG